MTNHIRFYCSVVICLLGGNAMTAADQDVSARAAIDRNADSLTNFNTYYFDIKQEGVLSLEPDASIVLEVEWKIWRSGIRKRQLSRTYYNATSDGMVKYPDDRGDGG